jgi:hypothetical protein
VDKQLATRQEVAGHDFFNSDWEWKTFDDPTQGRVNYTDMEFARTNGLAWSEDEGRFGMAGDSCNKINSSDPSIRGRNSVRIETYGTWKDVSYSSTCMKVQQADSLQGRFRC